MHGPVYSMPRAALLCVVVRMAAAAWTQFGHDTAHTGRVTYVGPLQPVEKWNVSWSTFYDSNTFIAVPAYSDTTGLVYIGSLTGEFLGIHADSGVAAWNVSLGTTIESSPALNADSTTVFFGTQGADVFALDAKTGEQKWRSEAGAAVVRGVRGCLPHPELLVYLTM